MRKLTGKVKWMDAKKGFGMISSEEVEGDIFFHYSELQIRGYKYLPPESRVRFDLQEASPEGTANGMKALNIEHLA